MPSVLQTRKNTNCLLFGAPGPIPTNVLPTIKDVICHLLMSAKNDRKQIPDTVSVAKLLEETWKRASIPTVSQLRIIQMMNDHLSARKAILKTGKGRRTTPAGQEKEKNFIESCNMLFDIAACKCKSFEDCVCRKERKVRNLFDYNKQINKTYN